ncbi:hypothetical protein ACQU0X_27150 [Pseudovibrio ascidiaceicola]|uniref:hypothetical protein n=1 Tax=Pseudovibrio ascidiaceicola TaxID=285279 RepID=UPI003D35FF7D
MNTLIRLASMFLAGLIGFSAPHAAYAQSQNPLESRNIKKPKIVLYLERSGITFTELGNEGGLVGLLGTSKEGYNQTFYVTPDGEHVVAGTMHGIGGTNVTSAQIYEMRKRWSAVMDAWQEDEKASSSDAAGATQGTEVPDVSASTSDADAAQGSKLPQTSEAPKTSQVNRVSAPSLPSVGNEADTAPARTSRLWTDPSFPAKDFLADLENGEAAFFTVGHQTAPVKMFMMADPLCPFCHRAWAQLKPLVDQGKIALNVMLISARNGSLPSVTAMLAHEAPWRAWVLSQAGQQAVPATNASEEALKKAAAYLHQNHTFARKYKLERTPFLAYVGPDKQFYFAVGLPNNLDSFLSAALPTPSGQ